MYYSYIINMSMYEEENLTTKSQGYYSCSFFWNKRLKPFLSSFFKLGFLHFFRLVGVNLLQVTDIWVHHRQQWYFFWWHQTFCNLKASPLQIHFPTTVRHLSWRAIHLKQIERHAMCKALFPCVFWHRNNWSFVLDVWNSGWFSIRFMWTTSSCLAVFHQPISLRFSRKRSPADFVLFFRLS